MYVGKPKLSKNLRSRPRSTLKLIHLRTRRGSHTATLLDNGLVLLTGGFSDDSHAISSAELFDPASFRFKTLPESLNTARAHAAVKLANGKVLLTGGSSEVFAPSSPLPGNSVFISTGEIFDPSEGSFNEIPTKMFIPRSTHAMAEMRAGLVIIVGGLSLDAAYNSETFSYTDFAQSLL